MSYNWKSRVLFKDDCSVSLRFLKLEIIWTVWSHNNKETQLGNLKISAEIATLIFLAQVRYFIWGWGGVGVDYST